MRGALLPNGDPTEETADQFFDLYQLMVTTSETLVGRRQGANTYFLTINGLLVTAIGVYVRLGGPVRLQAVGALILGIIGFLLAWVWRTLLISFGQLNTGKFAVITEMEKKLPAAIYSAEWEALERATNRKIYRTFTAREAWVPWIFGIIYLLVAVASAVIIVGWWRP